MTTGMTVTQDDTVNDVIALDPATVTVFGAWGIDTCCGGALPLRTVAERHQLDLEALLGELNDRARG